jgi:hypothetical protein
VISWVGRRPPLVEIPRLKPRGESRAAKRVDIADLVPEPVTYLAQAAYFQLGVFESLALAIANAPSIRAKENLSTAAGRVLAKHHGLVAEMKRRGSDPAAAMAPFAPHLDRFRQATRGADWAELLLWCFLTAGFLDDFFIRLSAGLPSDIGPRAAQILGEDEGTHVIVTELQAAIATDPGLASRLALWGRRLVGDTLLVARSAIHASGDLASDELRIEPVFTELIAAHTRRMDVLGLTA